MLIRHYIGDDAADTEDWDAWARFATQARGRRRLEMETMREAMGKALEPLVRALKSR